MRLTKATRAGEEELLVEAVPGIHARGLLGALLPPVMGSALEHRIDGEVRRRVYISGDTLTGDHVSRIAERHPDLDVAIVHLGGTRVLFHAELRGQGRGVPDGVAEVLDCFVRGQVETLLLDPEAVQDRTVDASAHPGLPLAGAEGETRADLLLVAAAVTTDAQVRPLPHDVPGPVTAVLRWDQEAS